MSRKRVQYQQSKEPPIVKPAEIKQEWGAFKTFLLSILSAILITIFFLLPLNRRWIETRIYKYYQDFREEAKNMDLDYRKLHRWGAEYNISKALKEVMDSTSVFLIPPQTYLVDNMFNEKNKQSHIWTYPSLLYYHLDHIKLVDLHSPDSLLAKATHTVWVRDQNGVKDLIIAQLSNRQRLDQVLEEFRKYELEVLFDPTSAQNWLNAHKDDSGR